MVLLYSSNFISRSCCNHTLLLEFERILVNWVQDLSANLVGMFGTFFRFFDLLSRSASSFVYFKLYTSFTQTNLVPDVCRDVIMETTFLLKSPYVYSNPYLWTISLSLGVEVASLRMKLISTKQTYSQDSWQ